MNSIDFLRYLQVSTAGMHLALVSLNNLIDSDMRYGHLHTRNPITPDLLASCASVARRKPAGSIMGFTWLSVKKQLLQKGKTNIIYSVSINRFKYCHCFDWAIRSFILLKIEDDGSGRKETK